MARKEASLSGASTFALRHAFSADAQNVCPLKFASIVVYPSDEHVMPGKIFFTRMFAFKCPILAWYNVP